MSRVITLTDQTPGFDSGNGYWYCLRNAGSQTVKLSADADQLSDAETGATVTRSGLGSGIVIPCRAFPG